jgi:hypothetical protein
MVKLSLWFFPVGEHVMFRIRPVLRAHVSAKHTKQARPVVSFLEGHVSEQVPYGALHWKKE